jgi:hypothetical protein
VWTWTRWPERREALRQFAVMARPDVFCRQELQDESQAVLDDVLLDTHDRVKDDFCGWTEEGNIYWNRQLFDLVEYGAFGSQTGSCHLQLCLTAVLCDGSFV